MHQVYPTTISSTQNRERENKNVETQHDRFIENQFYLDTDNEEGDSQESDSAVKESENDENLKNGEIWKYWILLTVRTDAINFF